MINMKSIKLFFYLSLFPLTSLFAQKTIDKETLNAFKTATQDSVFLSKNSDRPYSLETFDFASHTDTSSQLYQDLFHGKTGEVYGPYYTDTSIFYIKILNMEIPFKTRVGNIWIDIKKGRETALEQANGILTQIKAGKDYNLYCILYSDDRNKKPDCDLGWVYNTNFVEPFATEITRHKKDDVYIVETSFGFHVVKSLADPYQERRGIKYVSLVRKK
jgi:hypothetical protein